MTTDTLFQDVRVFDGHNARLSDPTNVLIKGRTIASLSAAPDSGRAPETTVIPCAGRTLMPGLIDAHWHAALAATPLPLAMSADFGYLTIAAARQAEATLMRGFTSVRDLGGPVLGLKRAIDEGLAVGPRIFPSGAFITQTGGHGDFRMPHEIPRPPNAPLSYAERMGATAIADGPDEVRLRAREQLMLGATQIKLMAGGGVASAYDPIDVSQYTEAEFRAAVEAAENWGTYVTVHAYTPRAIRTAIAGGVKCIEHGHLADDATAREMADNGIWWCLQPFVDSPLSPPMTGPARAKQLFVQSGTEVAYGLARKYNIKTAWGTDILFNPAAVAHQGGHLAIMARWYTPAEILTMATRDNAELLALCGPRNPYPGTLGVVEEGALADLLLVDGDPIADINLVADAGKFLVIMKDGTIFKNLLSIANR